MILALDVLYFSGEERINAQSKATRELSELLTSLPIHPLSARGEIFRNQKGVTDVILNYRRTVRSGKKDPHVGALFYEIGMIYEDRLDELHAIAEAIRKNIPFYGSIPFGNDLERENFPEGALLCHLHRVIEARDGARIVPKQRCEVCMIETVPIYKNCPNLLEQHLIIPVVELDGNRRYGQTHFITVCPNCHKALHRYRPWLTKENCGELLR